MDNVKSSSYSMDFFNSPKSLGSFWHETDITAIAAEDNFEDFAKQEMDFLNDHFGSSSHAKLAPVSTFANLPVKQNYALVGHACMCHKCKRPVILCEMQHHIENCVGIVRETIAEKSAVLAAAATSSSVTHLQIDSCSDAKNAENPKSASPTSQNARSTPNGSQSAVRQRPPKRKAPIVLDLDKHCGVLNEENVQCLRALTCKSHSMSLKRAVTGRSMEYDKLLARHHSLKAAANSSMCDSGLNASTPITFDHSAGVAVNGEGAGLSPSLFSKYSKGTGVERMDQRAGYYDASATGALYPHPKKRSNKQNGAASASGTFYEANATIAVSHNPDPLLAFIDDPAFFSDLSRVNRLIKDFYNKHSADGESQIQTYLFNSFEFEYADAFYALVDKTLNPKDIPNMSPSNALGMQPMPMAVFTAPTMQMAHTGAASSSTIASSAYAGGQFPPTSFPRTPSQYMQSPQMAGSQFKPLIAQNTPITPNASYVSNVRRMNGTEGVAPNMILPAPVVLSKPQ